MHPEPMITERARDRLGEGTAVFDGSRAYRYRLTRIWDPDLPIVTWCLLNPSTADGSTGDPTLHRVVGFSRSWGFGGVVVVNLFAWKSPSPTHLIAVPDPVGPANDRYVGDAVANAHTLVVAWGNGGALPNPSTSVPRCEEVSALLEGSLQPRLALDYTGRGQPRHPLYLSRDTRPIPWD